MSTPFIRPAAPVPRPRRPGLIATVRALRTNPLLSFSAEAYRARVLRTGASGNILLVSDPDAICRVLVDNAANYRKSIQQQRRIQPALGEGLLTAEGEVWRATRRVAAPLFSPRAIALLFDDMIAAAAAMAERWRGRLAPDVPLDIAMEFQRLTYEIVSRTVFSGALDVERGDLHASMAVYFDTIGRVDLATMFNLPAWLPSLSRRRARPALATFRKTASRVVEGRRLGLTRGPRGGGESGDLLDRLLVASDPGSGEPLSGERVSDNLLTFLAAGHDTTANALAWTLYLLCLRPDIEDAVRAEIVGVTGGAAPSRADLDSLPLLRAVANEALRLYPPAPFMGREAIAADRLAGVDVAAGTSIIISPWVVHRHTALWEEADAFQPERFLAFADQTPPRGTFIPFGLGPRICIGREFAMQEILGVLAVILPAFRFALAKPDLVFPRARITLQPAGGLPMRVKAR